MSAIKFCWECGVCDLNYPTAIEGEDGFIIADSNSWRCNAIEATFHRDPISGAMPLCKDMRRAHYNCSICGRNDASWYVEKEDKKSGDKELGQVIQKEIQCIIPEGSTIDQALKELARAYTEVIHLFYG